MIIIIIIIIIMIIIIIIIMTLEPSINMGTPKSIYNNIKIKNLFTTITIMRIE